MSSELHKYIESAIENKEDLYNAEVINFPNDKKTNKHKDHREQRFNFWSLKDKSNIDQLRAVIGVCFMIGALIVMGLYSNFI